MAFLQRGIGGRPLKQSDNRKLKFSEFGIIKEPESEKPNSSNKAVEVAKRLGGKETLNHEFLIQNWGGNGNEQV